MGNGCKWQIDKSSTRTNSWYRTQDMAETIGNYTTLQDDPSCWDLQVDNLLFRASSRMHILRICRRMATLKNN